MSAPELEPLSHRQHAAITIINTARELGASSLTVEVGDIKVEVLFTPKTSQEDVEDLY